jgi:cytoskeletal protein RodZ
MASLGETLKEARLKKGLSLKELASKTRIQIHFLEAIEENNLEVIPGTFFRKSFVRQYAEELGLDPKSFETDTNIQFGSYPANEDLSQVSLPAHEQPDLPPLPTPGREGSLSLRQVLLSMGLLIGVVAVCAVAFMFWEEFQTRQRQESVSSEPPVVRTTPPPATASEITPPASESTSDTTAASEQPSPPVAATPQSASITETAASASLPEGPAPPAATEAPRAETPSTTTHGSGSRELRLTADALTWVRVREGDRTIYMGTIDAGQSRVIRVAEGAQVLTGNAGSLKVFWQGSDVGKIGPSGQVRTVILTPEGFSIQAPAPKTPAPSGESPSSPPTSGEAR